jgi:hypothetical protein
MPDELYVHHTIAKLVSTYPSIPSIGTTMPTKLVITRGSKQYPSTDALRGNVRVEDRCEDEAWEAWSLIAAEDDSDVRGGDMSDRIRCSEVEPRRARP